jgi:hypothetical protein
MEYIIVKDNKIFSHCCGATLPENAIEINGFSGIIGDPISYYDSDNGSWKRKSDIELYSLGLIDVPDGYKLNEDKTDIIEMSLVEKISVGLEKCPSGYKLENGKFVQKTEEEKLADGDISQKKYYENKLSEYTSKLSNTDYIDNKIIEGVATKEDYADIIKQRQEWREEAAKLKEKIANI